MYSMTKLIHCFIFQENLDFFKSNPFRLKKRRSLRLGYLIIKLNLILSGTPNALKIIDVSDPVYAIMLCFSSSKIFSKVVAGTFFNSLYITLLQLGFNMCLRQLGQVELFEHPVFLASILMASVEYLM